MGGKKPRKVTPLGRLMSFEEGVRIVNTRKTRLKLILKAETIHVLYENKHNKPENLGLKEAIATLVEAFDEYTKNKPKLRRNYVESYIETLLKKEGTWDEKVIRLLSNSKSETIENRLVVMLDDPDFEQYVKSRWKKNYADAFKLITTVIEQKVAHPLTSELTSEFEQLEEEGGRLFDEHLLPLLKRGMGKEVKKRTVINDGRNFTYLLDDDGTSIGFVDPRNGILTPTHKMLREVLGKDPVTFSRVYETLKGWEGGTSLKKNERERGHSPRRGGD